MQTIEVNPTIIEAGNKARRRAIVRQIEALEAELLTITPRLSDILDARD